MKNNMASLENTNSMEMHFLHSPIKLKINAHTQANESNLIYYILSSNKGIFVWSIWPEVNCPYFHTPGK
jgi:hypothetical protein